MQKTSMTPYQILMVGICVMLNMNDGIDVLLVSFSSTEIMKEWNLTKTSMGYVFSAGLVGMMLGSFLIAPLSDKYGRKKVFISCLLMISAGMLSIYFCTSYTQLLGFRLLTGLGIGGILPALAATASEVSAEENRDFNVGLVQAGWPIGSILTGLVCSYTIPALGWRFGFLMAAILSLSMLAVVSVCMKEQFKSDEHKSSGRIGELFQPYYRFTTFRLWTAIFFAVLTLHTLLSWIPTIAKEAGLPFDFATYVGVVLNIGAALGTILIGLIAKRENMGIQKTVFGFLISAVLVMVLYGVVKVPTPVTFLLIFLIGIFVQGGFNGNYAIMARAYPSKIRGTGIGMAIGVGRLGAIIGPALFGILSDQSISISLLFCLFSLPLLVTAIGIRNIQLDQSQ